MIGALLGEVFGTGILGALLSFPIAKFLLDSSATVFFFIIPFMTSILGGRFIAFLLLQISALKNPLE
ncbi:energy coupling factor transporter S component ThiW [Marinisporobacter balticus]|uniref:energy coupling factor transporter S component ThiW n=1 Tax=Marinisporobacter balticus TaxID=2018667 RepID=UPI002ED03473